MNDVGEIGPLLGTLVDGSGVVLGRTEVHHGEPRRRLEFRPSVELTDGQCPQLAADLRRSFPDHRLSVSEARLADALDRAGALQIRRSCLMSLRPLPDVADLRQDSAGPAVEIAVMQQVPERYADLLLRAYPPAHPDHDADLVDLASTTAMMSACFDGRVVGPFIATASAEAMSPAGDVVGGIVVSDMPVDEAYPGGPWITELFIDPDHHRQGIGRALMLHTIDRLRADGRADLGLSVHLDNPARALYEQLGFAPLSSWRTFIL